MNNKGNCKYCGREMGLKGLFQHEKCCVKNPINIALQDLKTADAKKKSAEQSKQREQQAEQQQQQPAKVEVDPRPAIPLSLCSRDIGYVKENKPFYMKVMGRKVGDKVYVEEVGLMKL